jgi:hypothetical protein
MCVDRPLLSLINKICKIVGLQFSDVNAFLTLAATSHTLQPEDLQENPRVNQIVIAARAGRVPVKLVSGVFSLNLCISRNDTIFFPRSVPEESPPCLASRC